MARVTYLGSFDDKVVQYHKYDEAPIKTLNEILISELVFADNSTILLNDGYIVQSPIVQQALLNVGEAKTKQEIEYYTHSPLFQLIKRNHVKVLSRKNNLVEMIQQMADDGIRSYQKIVKIPGWDEKFGQLDNMLAGSFIPWPTYEMGEGFINLINGISADSTGLKRHADSYIFQKMRDAFNRKLDGSKAKTRDVWETVAEENYPDHLTGLMSIGNRAYHYNFALCLQAQPYKDDEVFVNSISSSLFADKATKVINTDVDLRKLSFKIPEKITFNEDFIDALGKDGKLTKYKEDFLRITDRFLNGKYVGRQLTGIQNAFKREVMDFDYNKRYARTDARIGLGIEIAMEAIVALVGNDPTVDLVTQVIGEMAPGGVSAIRKKMTYSGQHFELSPRRAFANKIEAMQISPEKAENHASELTFFK